VLLIGLEKLSVLVLDLLGVARRPEQELLEVVVQVLAGLRRHLAVGDPRFQFANECRRCSRRRQRAS
jgi:hypothetical protein